MVDSLIVVLEQDQSADDIEVLVSALMQFKGVCRVLKNVPEPSARLIADTRAREELILELIEMIRKRSEYQNIRFGGVV